MKQINKKENDGLDVWSKHAVSEWVSRSVGKKEWESPDKTKTNLLIHPYYYDCFYIYFQHVWAAYSMHTTTPFHAMQCNAFYDCTHAHTRLYACTHVRPLHCDNEQNTQLKWNPTKNNHKLILSKKFCGCLLFALGSHPGFFPLLFSMCSGNFVCAGTAWMLAQAKQRVKFIRCFCWHMFTVRYFVFVRARVLVRLHYQYIYTQRFVRFTVFVYEFVRFLIRSNALNNAMGKCKRSETRSSKHWRAHTHTYTYARITWQIYNINKCVLVHFASARI